MNDAMIDFEPVRFRATPDAVQLISSHEGGTGRCRILFDQVPNAAWKDCFKAEAQAAHEADCAIDGTGVVFTCSPDELQSKYSRLAVLVERTNAAMAAAILGKRRQADERRAAEHKVEKKFHEAIEKLRR